MEADHICSNAKAWRVAHCKSKNLSKVQVSDRTMTVEELAAEEQQRLQRLEAQRLKRLRGPSGDELGDEDESGAEGDDTIGLEGFAGRRAKRRKREAQGKLAPV